MAPSANRKRTILALVLAGSLVGAALALPALAAVTKKLYTPTISPITSAPGATQSYTFTIGNAPTSNQSLGSANISVPSGFTVSTTPPLTVSAPAGKTWTAALSGSTILLRSGATSSNGLSPGQQVSVTFDADAPCAAAKYEWRTQVKQSNDFLGNNNDFSLATGAAYASVTVSSGACSASATSDDGNSSVTVVSDGTGTLSVTFDSVPLNCDSTGETFQVGVGFTIDPPSDATHVTATFDDKIIGPFAAKYPVCKTYAEGPSPRVVPFCTDNGNVPPCVESQEIQFHGDAPTHLITVVKMTATDPRTLH